MLRLLSGDGFMESKTLGWIWMYTDTGGNQTRPVNFQASNTPFFLVAFFLKAWVSKCFFKHWEQPKTNHPHFFLFLETFAASLYEFNLFFFGEAANCQAIYSATLFFRPYSCSSMNPTEKGVWYHFFCARMTAKDFFRLTCLT